MPADHRLEQILNEYIKAAGLQSGQRLPWIIVITDKVACFKPPPSVLGVDADSSLLPQVFYELDYCHLVHGRIGVSHPRHRASGYLVQANQPMGSPPFLGDRDLGGGDRRGGTADHACAESRATRESNLVCTHPRVFHSCVDRGFVRLYFNAGRPWLGHTVCGLRLLEDLIINFFSVPNKRQ